MLHVMARIGVPSAPVVGIVEITPDREYLLVTDFLSGAVEISDIPVDQAMIDEGLEIVGTMWRAGLAHRDIKPANVMVQDDHLRLIDVAFAQVRPSPWRQAVDLANMMLVLALQSSPELVYERALLRYTDEELAEAFAAAPGCHVAVRPPTLASTGRSRTARAVPVNSPPNAGRSRSNGGPCAGSD